MDSCINYIIVMNEITLVLLLSILLTNLVDPQLSIQLCEAIVIDISTVLVCPMCESTRCISKVNWARDNGVSSFCNLLQERYI